MRYRRLALIFCIGLRREAGVVHRILAGRGFDVLSVACKVGRVPKEVLGLDESRKVAPGSYESMCNPILQAMIANRYGSDFNVLLGLCVGHDSMFFDTLKLPRRSWRSRTASWATIPWLPSTSTKAITAT